MAKILFCIALAASVSACGDGYVDRGVSGAGMGAGTALLMAGNPLIGLAIGAATGALTAPANVDMGPGPLEMAGVQAP